MKLKNYFCQFPNPWVLRVLGMGCYTSKCEKIKKSLYNFLTKRHRTPEGRDNLGNDCVVEGAWLHPEKLIARLPEDGQIPRPVEKRWV
jgi:hypothetical protein